MKRVAIVSPHFPPSTLAGVHRARFLVRHLPDYDWDPVVFCVHERHHKESLDPELANMVSPRSRVVKTEAWPLGLCRLFGVSDLSLRGYFRIRSALTALIERERVDLLLITTAPYYTALLGPYFKRKYNLPFVLDFQDPWVSKWGATLPRWSKGGIAHQLAVALEPKAVRHADAVVSVSEGANDDLRERYSFLRDRPMAAIPIGGEPDDFAYLRDHPPEKQQVRLDDRFINLCYVGTYWPRLEPSVRAVMRGFAELLRTDPAVASRIRLTFVGTSGLPDGHQEFKISRLAADAGISAFVTEKPQRVSYIEAIYLMATAHGLLLVGSDERHYTASKIYPALLSGRPCLGIFHEASSACDVLLRSGNALVLQFATNAALEMLAPQVAAALKLLVVTPERLPPVNAREFTRYTARCVTEQFARIFDAVLCRKAIGTDAGAPAQHECT